jgi:hypothetical protein
MTGAMPDWSGAEREDYLEALFAYIDADSDSPKGFVDDSLFELDLNLNPGLSSNLGPKTN